MLVVERTEVFEGCDQFRDRLEVADPEQLFLKRFEEAFDTTIAFRLADEGRRRFDAQETDLVLEVVAHELRAVIRAELQSVDGARVEAAEVLLDRLTDRFKGFKACRAFHGMNTGTFGRTVIDGGKDGDLALLDRYSRRGIDAPHLVRTIGGDGAGMRLRRHRNGLTLRRQQLGLSHQAQHPGLGGPNTRHPEACPGLPMAFPGKQGIRQIGVILL